MSRIRTKLAESATKRGVGKDPQSIPGRMTRAELMPPGPLLEYIDHAGGNLKWCNAFYGGESRAG